MEAIGELIGKLFALAVVWLVALGMIGACVTSAVHRHDLFLVLAAIVLFVFALVISKYIIAER